MKPYIFTPELKSFFQTYKPADRHFTSAEEIESIRTVLKSSGLVLEHLRDLRNDVVELYSDLMDAECSTNGATEIAWGYNISMMSATAVIDHFMYGSF